MVDQVKLDYWKERLEREKINAHAGHVSIHITPQTLEWFIETIEFLQSKQ